MLTLDDFTISFVSAGLFDTDSKWLHPCRTIDTFELLYVTAGKVHISEGEARYSLVPGDLLLLRPGTEHGGTEPSFGHTSFYWLHFAAPGWTPAMPQPTRPPRADTERTFAELLHLSQASVKRCELALMRLLLDLSAPQESRGDRLAGEVAEYIRINANRPLSVAAVARRFGFDTDYLSRKYKRAFGVPLKTDIDRKRLDYIKSMLLSSDYTIKDIAQLCGFPDENALIKFFRYHSGQTLSDFRNGFFFTHMNNH